MNIRSIFLTILVSLLLVSCQSSVQPNEMTSDELESNFKKIPDSTKLAVYWYWISDNLSKDGVIKDLQAMKKVGINRAFIGNIGLPEVEYGKVKVFSDEWWDILHTALKTATDLGIEIGIFNGPGWSQSGGPWVKPEQSMRYLASASVAVEGGLNLRIALPTIKESQDVKVLAYPQLPEQKKTCEIIKKEGCPYECVIEVPERGMRTLTFMTNNPIKTTGKIFAECDGAYQLLKSFPINRSNPAITVGFDPYAPIVISLPVNESNRYKFVMEASGSCNAQLTLSTKPYVERYPEKSLAKMFQDPLPMWKDYLWEEQPLLGNEVPTLKADQILDLTSYVSNDSLTYTLPKGKWKIVRFAMKTTNVKNGPASPEAIGLETDKMSRKHIESHFNAFLGEILRRIPEADRKCFKVTVMDSYETGGLNWTDDMGEKFEQTYGYDPTPYLPVLRGEIVDSPELSDRFLWDLRRLIADRVSYDYVGGLRDISHKHGLTTWLENYGHWGYPGEFLQYGGQSDEIAGEYWSEGSLGDIENRAASSCGHIYGKQKIWAESFTAGGKAFARYPYLMKQRGDRFFTEGINATLLHLYIHQPYEDRFPGVNAPFSNEFNRKNTWFDQMPAFINYLKRCNVMLQQGKYIADVAYFIGEDTPKMTGVTNPALPKGYSFDYINGEVLTKYASMDNGSLTLKSGMKYRVLVLPDLKTMRPELLSKIQLFVKQGLIVAGPAPEKSPSLKDYPNADKKVAEVSAEMWSNPGKNYTTYGKGRVYNEGCSLTTILEENDIKPDMKTDEKDPLLFIHRKTNDCDIYFVSNQAERSISVSPIFRVDEKQPELWNPLTSEIRYLTEYELTEHGIQVPLELQPFESAFIVFRSQAKSFNDSVNYPNPQFKKVINEPWTVDFINPFRKAEGKSITMNELISWTEMNDKDIRYHAGTAIYKTQFTLNKKNLSNATYLDLGKVMVMATVKLNGKEVGGVWTPPYRIPVTDFVKEGQNMLEIEVVNNWVNRLIGDLRLPEEQRNTWTNINPWNADSPLQESGLLGPVEIVSYDYQQFN